VKCLCMVLGEVAGIDMVFIFALGIDYVVG